MINNLSDSAIASALSADWQNAVKFNKLILKENPQDIDALTRLARAYLEMNNHRQAKRVLKQAQELDPVNPIAIRLATKLDCQGLFSKRNGIKTTKNNSDNTKDKCGPCDSDIYDLAFIDLGPLTHTYKVPVNKNTTEAKNLLPGQGLILNPQGFCISILSSNGKFVGRLNGYTSQLIKKQLCGKVPLQAVVKSMENNCLEIILLAKN